MPGAKVSAFLNPQHGNDAAPQADRPAAQATGDARTAQPQPHFPKMSLLQRFRRYMKRPDVMLSTYAFQLVACLLFIVLYVWGTYSPALPGSLRYNVDLCISFLFMLDYAGRIMASGSPLYAAFLPLNVIDLLSFAPSLVEVAMGCDLPWDLRWCRVFRRDATLLLCLYFGWECTCQCIQDITAHILWLQHKLIPWFAQLADAPGKLKVIVCYAGRFVFSGCRCYSATCPE